ncbi:hypothetical protein O1611_g130 [Lasiodiplodia mahajangana]|uniref:Uncharacterized protein n=1 Tax=Lasiodiplodia mahajangana TaxID=1108764 RepID=A0ACC2K1W7_9PEZI|nr:hypothetical protein O1611_g130 [Lasiodiplodia mahajangana]
MVDYSGDSHSADQCPGNDHLDNVHPGDHHSGDKHPEDEHQEGEDSEEELSESEHSVSERKEEEEEELEESEEEEEEFKEEWYEYLGIDAQEYNSKDDSDSDSDYGWKDDGKERTFPKFMQLPTEIRMMIWQKALPKGRTLRIAPPSDDIDQWGLPREMFAPKILNPERFKTMPLAGVC